MRNHSNGHKTIIKIIAMAVVCLFFLNTTVFALSPPVLHGQAMEGDLDFHRTLALAQIGLQEELMGIDMVQDIDGADTVEKIRSAFSKKEELWQEKRKTVVRTKGQKEIVEIVPRFEELSRISQHGCIFSIPVDVAAGDKITECVLLFSTFKRDPNGGFPSAICTIEELNKIDSTIRRTGQFPVRSKNDELAILMHRVRLSDEYDRLHDVGAMYPAATSVEGDKTGELLNRQGHVSRGIQIALRYKEEEGLDDINVDLIKLIGYLHELGRLPYVHNIEKVLKNYFSEDSGLVGDLLVGTKTKKGRYLQTAAQEWIYGKMGLKLPEGIAADVDRVILKEKDPQKFATKEARLFYFADTVLGHVEDFALNYKCTDNGESVVGDFDNREEFLQFIFGEDLLEEMTALRRLSVEDFDEFVVRNATRLMRKIVDAEKLAFQEEELAKLDGYRDGFESGDFFKKADTLAGLEYIREIYKAVVAHMIGQYHDERIVASKLLDMTEQDILVLARENKLKIGDSGLELDEYVKGKNFPAKFGWRMDDLLAGKALDALPAIEQPITADALQEELQAAGCATIRGGALSDTDRTTLIFSQKITFDEGVGVLLPQLANAGIKIGVVAATERQRTLIEELNLDLSPENKIVYANDPLTLSADLRNSGYPRQYYFKTGNEDSIPNVVIVEDEIVKRIIDILGTVMKLPVEKFKALHEAAHNFSVAA